MLKTSEGSTVPLTSGLDELVFKTRDFLKSCSDFILRTGFILLICFFSFSIHAQTAVLTQHNDLSRTGANLCETGLTVTNVNTNSFGLLYTRAVDDQIFAQPLVMTNVSLPGKGTHNLVIVCTVNDTVYAYDADDSSVTAPYWQASMAGTNEIPFNNQYTSNPDNGGPCLSFSFNMGIISTPVIDPATGTIYIVARTILNLTNAVQKLHALDITTGLERTNSPIVIAASVPGNGDGSSNGVVSFDPLLSNQRVSLALVNGVVYFGWASSCDVSPYHGWLMGYDAATMQQRYVYNSTPEGIMGGIWMSGAAPAADELGNIYVSIANGTVGLNGDPSNTINRGESLVKLSPDGTNLNVASWFTPFDWPGMNAYDLDFGTCGVMLIPGTQLAVAGSKTGNLYVVNRDAMGGVTLNNYDDNIVQFIPVTANEVHGSPIWWNGPGGSFMYVWPAVTNLQQFQFDTNLGLFDILDVVQGPDMTPDGEPGGILSLSANGTNSGTGIVWANHQYSGNAEEELRPGILRAFDAENVSHELWNSEQTGGKDSVGQFAKFVPPTIANGKVYMATLSGRLNVYGLYSPLTGPPQLTQDASPLTSYRYPGGTVKYSIFVLGQMPMSYQWFFNGSNAIPGATNSVLSLTHLQGSNAGAYSCVITNSEGVTNTSDVYLTILAAPSSSYAQTVLADSPVAYWRLDETNGSVARDYVQGLDGRYTNVVLGVEGFNPLNSKIAPFFGALDMEPSLVGGIPLDFGSAFAVSFSIEAWVKENSFPQYGYEGIFYKGTGNEEQFGLEDNYNSSGTFSFYVKDTSGGGRNEAIGTIYPDGNWHHLVGVCDEFAGTVTLYVDGVSNAVAYIYTGIQRTSLPAVFGSNTGLGGIPDYDFIGSIDEVAAYNYALTPIQVAHHYSVGTNLPPVILNASTIGNQIQLVWPGGTLQCASQPQGPFYTMTNASSPLLLKPDWQQKFFRVKVR